MLFSIARTSFGNHCRSVLTLSRDTVRAYDTDLRNAEQLFGGARRLDEITKDDLRRYIRHLREERRFTETSIKRRVASLKLLFRWAVRETVIAANPFDTLDERIRLPKRLPRVLDRHDANLLRRAVTPTIKDEFDELAAKTAIQLLLGTGVRIAELSNIRISDVSLSDRCIRITGKGNRQRLVYLLSPTLFMSLDDYVSKRQDVWLDRNRLFITSSGLDMTPQRVRAALHQVVAGAGIERRVTPHMLRHTCATQWLENGLDIRYVQKLLGHQSISTTEIYTHVSDVGLREALARLGQGEACRAHGKRQQRMSIGSAQSVVA